MVYLVRCKPSLREKLIKINWKALDWSFWAYAYGQWLERIAIKWKYSHHFNKMSFDWLQCSFTNILTTFCKGRRRQMVKKLWKQRKNWENLITDSSFIMIKCQDWVDGCVFVHPRMVVLMNINTTSRIRLCLFAHFISI